MFAVTPSLCTISAQEAPGALSLPLDPVLIPAGIILITGIFMLLVGRRMLRCGLGIMGALAGALLGNAIAPILPALFAPVVMSVLGGILGLGLGLLLWRVTIASVMAGSCAAVASLCLLLAMQAGWVTPVTPGDATVASTQAPTITPVGTSPEPMNPTPTIEERLGDAAATALKEDAAARIEAMQLGVNKWLALLNESLGGIITRVTHAWSALEQPFKSALIGSTVLGALFGFLFGIVAWKWSSAVVNALAGSGLVLIGALFFLEALLQNAQASPWNLPPGLMLAGWAILAGSGGFISWYFERRRADTENIETA